MERRSDLDRDRVGSHALECQVRAGFLQLKLHLDPGRFEAVVDFSHPTRPFQHKSHMEIGWIRPWGGTP